MYWHGPRKVELPLLFDAASTADALLSEYPRVPDLLALRLMYSRVEENRAFFPYLEIAYPYVMAGQMPRGPEATWLPEMEAEFYGAFYLMWSRFSVSDPMNVKMKEAMGEAYCPVYPRHFYLFEPDQKAPSAEDLAMWVALLMEYAESHGTQDDRWEPCIERIKQVTPELVGKMSREEARIRLSMLMGGNLSERVLHSKPSQEVDAIASAAYLKGASDAQRRVAREEQGNRHRLSESDTARLHELEQAVAIPVESWAAHKSLCDFYAQHGMRDAAEYPPAAYGPKDSPILLAARCYYRLIVRASGSRHREEASTEALALSEELLETEPEFGKAYAFRAMAFVRLDRLNEAEAALAEAQRLAPEEEETRLAEDMVRRLRLRAE